MITTRMPLKAASTQSQMDEQCEPEKGRADVSKVHACAGHF
jgi:hypothetical protein